MESVDAWEDFEKALAEGKDIEELLGIKDTSSKNNLEYQYNVLLSSVYVFLYCFLIDSSCSKLSGKLLHIVKQYKAVCHSPDLTDRQGTLLMKLLFYFSAVGSGLLNQSASFDDTLKFSANIKGKAKDFQFVLDRKLIQLNKNGALEDRSSHENKVKELISAPPMDLQDLLQPCFIAPRDIKAQSEDPEKL